MMSFIDRLLEQRARSAAQQAPRRGMLKALGGVLVGASTLPLLPVARAAGPEAASRPQESGSDTDCDYWRYCAIDGFLCSCCGGSANTCPPGTEMSPVTWIGTCHNPADGRNYVISYNDCCGKPGCGACLCQRDEGDRPPYRPDKTNDINWCLGTSSAAYHCSAAVVVGVAFEE
ncbi:methylamine dehydrogenase (amicyanin) light chain [Luminiphilus sp.]|jgi:methylamine dehydrogenase light chain|nr:methylamine dehydrogenase (amicyanin) light chain [Halieaceae bacterium]MDA7585897.1 methylamine dehydrogenase (amicyanin) light chain [Luminiphilus sp.]MDA8659059.1 methylamine dehydrogenase (amicyanin) light chain [Luminiphilus sp.]MDA9579906.1 methylamine dehydrogenase (amicyanin) light chain [Luminiphilus sp.]MDA9847939.1 methylamine dehydrogenase (amicyanin) light chain [Luminiphilus sp.]